MKNKPTTPRRQFIRNIGLAVGTFSLITPQFALTACTSGGNQEGAATGTDTASSSQTPQKDKLGIALVGLGNYAGGQLAPALQETKNCYLAGIVTGTPAKAEEWKKKYNIPDENVYSYESYDDIANNPDIDIIYVVLPNAMHPEYVIRGAKAGKHMISEKPMATTVEDCQRMIDACNENKVKLSIGYRLHFEPHNQRVMELGQQKVYGNVKNISGAHSFTISDPSRWRLDKKLAGGGPLMDVGIYVVQGACYTLGETPVAVTASYGKVTKPDLFSQVEQSIHWEMEFRNGIVAKCDSSYAEGANYLKGEAENGWWELSPAYSYGGIEGKTSEGPMDLPQVNQQARQMDAFADCIIHDKETTVPGEMGLRDVRILMAIYESADKGGKRVEIEG